jgi:DHA2 family multidrug resistance protein
MSVLAFATLDKGRITDGMSVFHLVRNFGSSLFISLSIVLLVRSTAASYSTFTEHISPFNRVLAYPGSVGLWNLDSQGGLFALANELQRQAAMIGYINAFYLFAFTAALSVPVAFLMRDVPRE